MLERDINYNDIIDRIERLEAQIESLRDVARPSEVVIYENPTWQSLVGWVSTGAVLRSLGGEIVLDPNIPMIRIGENGYIQSEDFAAGTSGFQIDGGEAEFNDVVVRGTIYADAGEIAGWTITADQISSSGDNVVLDVDDGIGLLAPASLVRATYVQWDISGGGFRARIGCGSDGTLHMQGLSDVDIGVFDGSSTETQLLYVSAAFVAVLNTDLRVEGGLVVGSPSVDPSDGAIVFIERSSDPAEPAEGQAVIWMSDGTGKGDDGDVLIASQAGGVTRYAVLFDHSAGSAW